MLALELGFRAWRWPWPCPGPRSTWSSRSVASASSCGGPRRRRGSATRPSSTPAPTSLARGEGRESYDVVTARAVGRLSTLAELAAPLLREGGVLVAWKGKRNGEEEAQLQRAAEALAMEPGEVLDVGDRAGSRHRHLHFVRKAGPTPAELPRRAGMAKKRPRG